MTEEFGGIDDANEIERDGSDSAGLIGGETAASLIGQAAITVARPAPGENISIDAAAGQRYVIEFNPDAAQVRVQGSDLILEFADGGSVTFANLGLVVDAADEPVFEVAGQPISSAVIFALGEGTLQTAAAPTAVGTGETRYDDDTGELIDLLDAQPVIPPTELAFRLIDLEPTVDLLGVETNPPVDFDVDVTANFVESLAAAGLTFAPGLGFGTPLSRNFSDNDTGFDFDGAEGSSGTPELIPESLPVVDNNGTLETAQDIPRAAFTIVPDPNLGDDSLPSVVIDGLINQINDIDYFRFELQDGETVTLDIDFGEDAGLDPVDIQLHLLDAAGNVVAKNDDSSISNGGAGSIDSFDSFLQFTATTGGVFFVGVTSFNNDISNGGAGDDDGNDVGDYVLNISIDPTSASTGLGVPVFSDIGGSGSGGSIFITGHDSDEHGNGEYMSAGLDFLFFGGAATAAERATKSIAILDDSGGSFAVSRLLAEGWGSVVLFDTDFDFSDAFTFDAIMTASGRTNGTAFHNALIGASSDFEAFINDGGALYVNTDQGFGQTWYDFVPTFGTALNNTIGTSGIFTPTADGLSIGFTEAIVDRDITHSFYNGVDTELFTVFELTSENNRGVPVGLPVAFGTRNINISDGEFVAAGADPGGFLYEFQVGESEIVLDNIHGTDIEDGVTTQFFITSLPTAPNGTQAGVLFIDRGDDNLIDEIFGDGFADLPAGGIQVQTGDSVFYFLPKSDFADRPESVSFNYFTVDSDGLDSLGDGPATVTIQLPDPTPIVDATDATVDEDDLPQGESQEVPRISLAAILGEVQQPGSDTLDLGDPPFDPDGQQDTVVTGTITVDFSFDDPGTVEFDQGTIDTLDDLGLTSSTNDELLTYAITDAGLTLTAMAGSETVFTVKLSPGTSFGDFDYEFELIGSINHPLTDNPATGDVETKFEDPTVLPIQFLVTDLNGSTAIGGFNVDVTDDVPTIGFDGGEGAQAYSIDGNFNADLWQVNLDPDNNSAGRFFGFDGGEGSDFEGLTFGTNGQFLFAYDDDTESFNQRILKIDPDNGRTLAVWDLEEESAFRLFDPGFTVNAEGQFFAIGDGTGGVDDGPLGSLYKVNFEPGSKTGGTFSLELVAVQPADLGMELTGLAADPNDPSILYALGRVSSAGGEPTAVKLVKITLGDETSPATFEILPGVIAFTSEADSEHGLSFAPDGVLWGLIENDLANTGGLGSQTLAFQIDPETGASIPDTTVVLPNGENGFESLAVDQFDPGALKIWEQNLDGGEGTRAGETATVVFGADGPETDAVLSDDPSIVTADDSVVAEIKLDIVKIEELDETGNNLEGGNETVSSLTGTAFSSGLFSRADPSNPDSPALEVFLERPLIEGDGPLAGQVDPTKIIGYLDLDGSGSFTEGDVKVFEADVDLNQISNGEYAAPIEFELFLPLVHPDADNPETAANESEFGEGRSLFGADADLIKLSFTVTVTDDDGDSHAIPVTVTVDDDGPNLENQSLGMIQETDPGAPIPGAEQPPCAPAPIPSDGPSAGDVILEGTLEFSYGADGPGMFTALEFLRSVDPDGTEGDTDGVAFGALKSGGQEVTFGDAELVTENGREFFVLTGMIAGDAVALNTDFGEPIPVVEIRLDKATGDYRVILFEPLDHPDQGPVGTGQATEIGADDPIDLVLRVQVVDFDGDTQDAEVTLTIKDDGPTTTPENEIGVVEEEQLIGGNEDTLGGEDAFQDQDEILDGQGGAPDTFVDNTTNVVSSSIADLVDFGADGPAEGGGFSLSPDTSGLPALTSGGVPVIYDVTGDTLFGFADVAGAPPVFTLSLQSDGTYTFTLLAQLDHEAPFSGAVENILGIDFSSVVVATDFDGDAINLDERDFVIQVIDDVPVRTGESVMGVVEEEQNPVPGGNEDTADASGLDADTGTPGEADFVDNTTNQVSGLLQDLVEFGTDGAATGGGFSLSPDTSELPALTSAGKPVLYDVTGDTLTGFVNVAGGIDGLDPDDLPVFTLSLNPIGGAYTFTLLEQLDHEAPFSGAVENLLEIDFSSVIVATDFDGDSITLEEGDFVIKVIDDTPLIDGAEGARVTHDETPGIDLDADDTNDPLPMGLAAAIAMLGLVPIGSAQSASPVVSVNIGADKPGDLSLTDADGALLNGADSGLGRTSDGHDIFLFTDADDPRLVYGRAGTAADVADPDGDVVFLAFIDESDNTFWVTQFEAIEHPDALNNDDTVSVSGEIFVTATDGDGDAATAQEAVTVAFQDDGPRAGNIMVINDETAGLGDDTPSDDVDLLAVTIPGAISDVAAGLTPINASSKAIAFDYGTDGPGGIALDRIDEIEFPDGKPSGLFDTATGDEIQLFNGAGDTIIGRVGDAGGEIAFVSVIGDPSAPTGADNDSSADLWFVQYRAIEHDDPLDPDEAGIEGVPSIAEGEIVNSPGSIADLDIQGRGLNMILGGVGLADTGTGTISLDLSASVAVVSASLYWIGFASDTSDLSLGADESQITINGVDVDANRILGIEDGGTGFLNTGFAADVTGIVADAIAASADTSMVDFDILDSDLGELVTNLGAGLLVVYADGTQVVHRVSVFETIESAFGTTGDEIDPVVFSYGASETDQTGELALLVGDAEIGQPDVIDIESTANGGTSIILNQLDADDGTSLDADTFSFDIAAGSTETTVEIRSETNAELGGEPDSLLLAVAALRTEVDTPQDENIALAYTVTDGDGDTAAGTATITIEDDGPTAVNDVPIYLDVNVDDFVLDDVFDNDDIGVDGAADGGPVISFSYAGVDDAGNAVERTALASDNLADDPVTTFSDALLLVSPEGEWGYEVGFGDGISDAGYVETFTYFIRDADGDTDSATQQIRVVLESDITVLEGSGVIEGDIFDDFLSGDANENLILGFEGNDLLFGGGGNDFLFGGFDDDQLYGDGGADSFIYLLSEDEGTDFIGDFSTAEGDQLEFFDVMDIGGDTGVDFADVFDGSFNKVGSTVTVTLTSGTNLIIEDVNNAIGTLDDLIANSVIDNSII